MIKRKTAFDYKFIRLLGEGSFSSVYLAVDKDVTSPQIKDLNISHNESGIELESDSSDASPCLRRPKKIRKYAIKVCQKSYIKRQNKQVAIMREKEIMNILNEHPNKHFIRLYCTFQDGYRLFFVMTYADNGDLLAYMQVNPLSLNSVRTYTIQLITALEHMHKLGIVHRDLKPENILLSNEMDLLITDFGSAQIYHDGVTNLENLPDRRNSFVGTAQYVSPEMLKSRQATNKSDLWAFGVIIFQMITNVMPFNAPNEYLIYQKIQNLEYEYPDDFDPDARNLVESLIKLEPSERLGAFDNLADNGYTSIKEHAFLSAYGECEGRADNNYNRNRLNQVDLDLTGISNISPGLDETQLLRLLTVD